MVDVLVVSAAETPPDSWLPKSARQIRPTDVAAGVRLLDMTLSLIIVIFLAPLLATLAALIFLQDGGSPLFGHTRLGHGGREFRCLKFRTMVLDAEERLGRLLAEDPWARAEWASGQKLRCDPRITPLGKFLRRSSLDELPQVFNVLAGQMSLVGPRPIVRDEVVRYGRFFSAYCSVRPGITGLWQVSGRSDTSYRRRVALDVLYTRRRSLWLDLKLIALTIPAVLTHRGCY